jgi:hypothetical protein
MPRSKYPGLLDSSVELPAVRDNVTEISSDVINSLRSAIFQIEKTLGINPQGSVGNSVASRINNALDENGNILGSALDTANVLSGPILDVDVSDVAAIKEHKLNLNFPTQLLQDEISLVNNSLDSIILQLAEASALISTHINSSAVNRHNGTAISLQSSAIIPSDTATISLESGTVQGEFEKIYNAHINFSGANVSSLNNSHSAEQIYFDNSEVDSIIQNDNVQDALVDLVNIEAVGLRRANLNLNSNGRVRTGSAIDGYEALGIGTVLVSSAPATFIQAGGSSRTVFTFDSPQTPIADVEMFDTLTLSGSTTSGDNISYQVSEVTLSGGDITAIEVFGGPKGDSSTGLTVVVSKNTYGTYNQNGLNCTVRPRKDKSNTPDIFVANPDSATIISSGIQPSRITTTENSFDVSIDGDAAITIETHDASVSEQTIDSIVNKINERAIDDHLNIIAFKIKIGSCFELAISHTMPNISGDTKNRTIEVFAGSSDDGSSELGLANILDIEVEGSTSNAYHINGLVLNNFGSIQVLTGAEIEIIPTTLDLSLFSGTFAELGVRVGDTIVITGSSIAADDGSYRVGSILSSTATLDLAGSTLLGSLDENATVHIIRNTANIGELTFTEAVSVNGSIMFDVFITDKKDVHYHKRLEVDGEIKSGPFIAAVTDISKNFVLEGQSAVITIDTDGFGTLTGTDLLDGESIFVATSGTYKLFANDGLSFITIEVNASGPPNVQQQITLFGFNELSQNNLRLCRALFATSLGIILGESADIGIPSVVDRRRSGTVDDSIISETVLERFVQGPRNELRASGIIRGCEITNLLFVAGTYHTFDLSAGIAIVNGIRYELNGVEGFRVNTADDFYIAIDNKGCVVTGGSVTNPDGVTDGNITEISPFSDQVVAHLAFADATLLDLSDLRLFIDRIDLKLLGDIRVSKTQQFGHFTSIKKAVNYSRRFTEMFPDQGTPSIFIEEGRYEEDEQIILDFDIVIHGAGPTTIITKTGSFAAGTEPMSGNLDPSSGLFLIGGGPDTGLQADRIINGVTLRDFTYETSSSIANVGAAIILSQRIGTSDGAGEVSITTTPNATYRIQNINFFGPDSITDGGGVDSNKVGEYALLVSEADEATFVPSSFVAMGNIILDGCRLDRMGLELGGVLFGEGASSIYKNIIVTNNIATNMSPGSGSTGFVILEYPSTGSIDMQNIVENNNIVEI